MATQGGTLAFSTDYIRSRPGILRILEAIIGLCGIISESQGAYCGKYGMYSFYNFVVCTTLILAVVIIIIYLIGLDKLCAFINFPISIFINDVIFAILYLIAAILMFVTIGACRAGQAARIVAAIFGVFGTIVVGMLAMMGYQSIRSGSASTGASKSEPA